MGNLKTLKQVLDEKEGDPFISKNEGRHDIKARFDGREYALCNLINYLEPWWSCEAYTTEKGNIKFIPHGGDMTAAYIKIVGTEED